MEKRAGGMRHGKRVKGGDSVSHMGSGKAQLW